MVQKNFDIDRQLAEEFSQFCKERGMTLGAAVSAAILSYMQLDATEREQANLNLSNWLNEGHHASESKRSRAAKPLGGSKGKRYSS
ncbi:hypothetical protein KS4_21180 [Poriferisphaera corsica]|uniref:Uncharacterized protein n=1 Tax=Poriferisphaera corsica TaxID=2528020 RepID=A0A517YV12_9BACT|nr:hypothetical protein [Poriferisphaera corsica]QDU34056.1 hypothetical protein KS4_21180 [Poriferisphaera corsica]